MSWLIPTWEEQESKARQEFRKRFPYATVEGPLGEKTSVQADNLNDSSYPSLSLNDLRALAALEYALTVLRSGAGFTWRLVNRVTGLEETVKVELDYSASKLGIRFPDIDMPPVAAKFIRPIRELVTRYIPNWNICDRKPECKDFALAVAATLLGRRFTFRVTGSKASASSRNIQFHIHDTLLVWSDEISEIIIRQMVEFRKELEAIKASFASQKAADESFLTPGVTLSGNILLGRQIGLFPDFHHVELDGLSIYNVKLKRGEELLDVGSDFAKRACEIHEFTVDNIDPLTLTVTVSSVEVDKILDEAVKAKRKQENACSKAKNEAGARLRGGPQRDIHAPRLQIGEGHCVELKSSMIYSPETNLPDSRQHFNIAREIAAFMNADGGDLYLGVNDKGFVVGIDNDLDALNEAVISGQYGTDEKFAPYKPTHDGYMQKLDNIICFMLGKFAATFVRADFLKEGDVEYVKIHVNPSKTQFIYLGNGKSQDVYVRCGQSSRKFEGKDLIDYSEKRFGRG